MSIILDTWHCKGRMDIELLKMEEQKKSKDILVVGVGNILMGDEGIGIHVIKELEKLNLPEDVEIMDIGVSSFSLISYLSDRKKVIIIDAVKSGGKAGTIYRFSIENIEIETERYLSLHQIGIGDILSLLHHNLISGKVIIIGVEPGEIRWGMELSPCLKEKIPQILTLVLKEISPEER